MNKHEYYLGIHPNYYDISVSGAAGTICNIRNEITDIINESLKTKKTILIKITMEYGTEEECKKSKLGQ